MAEVLLVVGLDHQLEHEVVALAPGELVERGRVLLGSAARGHAGEQAERLDRRHRVGAQGVEVGRDGASRGVAGRRHGRRVVVGHDREDAEPERQRLALADGAQGRRGPDRLAHGGGGRHAAGAAPAEGERAEHEARPEGETHQRSSWRRRGGGGGTSAAQRKPSAASR